MSSRTFMSKRSACRTRPASARRRHAAATAAVPRGSAIMSMWPSAGSTDTAIFGLSSANNGL